MKFGSLQRVLFITSTSILLFVVPARSQEEQAPQEVAAQEAQAQQSSSSDPQQVPAEEKTVSPEVFEAINKQDFRTALLLLQKEVQEDNRNTVALRYMGIIYDRAGSPQDAIKAFYTAISISPNDPATFYYMGLTFFKMGKFGEALRSFETVMRLDPDGFYGQKVASQKELLDQIRATIVKVQQAQAAQARAKAPPKKLKFSGKTSYAYDTNALSHSIKGGAGEPRDNTLGYRLKVDYDFIKTKENDLNMNYAFAHNDHTYSHSLDTITNDWVISGNHYLEDNALRIEKFGLENSYNITNIDRAFYNWSVSLKESVKIKSTAKISHTLYHKITYQNYNGDGAVPNTSSKDGFKNALGIQNFWFLPKGMYVYLFYEYSIQDVRGSDFYKPGHSLNSGYHLSLPWKVGMDLTAGYTRDDYTRDTRAVRRFDDKYTYGVSFGRPINKNFDLKLSYNYTYNDSSVAANEYRNHTLKSELNFKF